MVSKWTLAILNANSLRGTSSVLDQGAPFTKRILARNNSFYVSWERTNTKYLGKSNKTHLVLGLFLDPGSQLGVKEKIIIKKINF